MSESTTDMKILLARVNDLADASLKKQEPQWTDFFDPAEREQAEAALRWKTGVRYISDGAYAKAERRRLVIYPDYYFSETIVSQLAMILIKPTAVDAKLNHRDFLGALMSLGIERGKFGDILVLNEQTGQVIMAAELADFVCSNLSSVGSYTVELTQLDPEQLQFPDQREKEIKTTAASLRLDALAALGFGESRTKIVKEIKSEKIKVNWKTVKNPDQAIEPGAVISMRGRGRVEFREVTGKSKKGRIGVLLVRYL